MTRRIYRSMQGQMVDMELLGQKNELAPAIGNVRVNARGDELGPGNKIIRKREDIMSEYYEGNPGAVRDENFVKPRPDPVPKLTEKTEKEKEPVKKTTAKKETKGE